MTFGRDSWITYLQAVVRVGCVAALLFAASFTNRSNCYVFLFAYLGGMVFPGGSAMEREFCCDKGEYSFL